MRSLTREALVGLVGRELAVSDWMTVDQERIDRFAEATGDHQWIHVDPVRASTGPYGKTVAHGFLTLSLIPHFFQEAIQLDGKLGINYGLEKVRFPHPVLVDSRIRARFLLKNLQPLPPIGELTGLQMTCLVTIECEGVEKPVCVAEQVSRRYW